jgi:hypothetical protein
MRKLFFLTLKTSYRFQSSDTCRGQCRVKHPQAFQELGDAAWLCFSLTKLLGTQSVATPSFTGRTWPLVGCCASPPPASQDRSLLSSFDLFFSIHSPNHLLFLVTCRFFTQSYSSVLFLSRGEYIFSSTSSRFILRRLVYTNVPLAV